MAKSQTTKPALFITTIGQRDIQVVLKSEGGAELQYCLANSSLRAFQEACVDGRINFRFLPLCGDKLPRQSRSQELDFDRDSLQLSGSIGENKASEKEWVSWSPLEGTLALSAPLLKKFFDQYRRSFADTVSINQVLMLTTRRPGRDDEPAHTFQLLRPLIEQELDGQLEYIAESVFEDDADIEVVTPSGETFPNPSLARVYDRDIKEALARYPDSWLLVSDVAGMPVVKLLLSSILSYRARPSAIKFVRPSDRKPSVARDSQISPIVSFDSRRLCKELCNRGAISAAAQVAKSTVADNKQLKQEPWRNLLCSLATVVQGDFTVVDEAQLWKANSEIWEIAKQMRSSGHLTVVAFRVEMALRSEDSISALRETFRFVETCRKVVLKSLAKDKKSLFFENGWPRWDRLTSTSQTKVAELWDAKRNEWTIGNQEDLCWALCNHLDDGLSKDKLLELAELINVTPDGGNSLRDIRNAATHDRVTSKQLRLANSFARQNGIWGTGKMKFLNSRFVTALLPIQAPNSKPAELFDAMLRAIEADMDKFSLMEIAEHDVEP